MNEDKVLNLLGLAQKAGFVVSGENTIENHFKKQNSLQLVLIAKDASRATKDRFSTKLANKKIKYIIYGSKELLGKNIGKSSRAIIGITDSGFAKKIFDLMEEEKP